VHMNVFNLGPVAEPLTPMAFVITCTCSQTVFAATGINLNVQLPEGMDIIASCRCGKQHSLKEATREDASNQEHTSAR